MAHINAGIFTYTLRQGRWSYRFQPTYTNVFSTPCGGYYDVTGNTITFSTVTPQARGTCSPPGWTSRWTFKNDRLLWSGPVTCTGGDDDWEFARIWIGDGRGWIKIK